MYSEKHMVSLSLGLYNLNTEYFAVIVIAVVISALYAEVIKKHKNCIVEWVAMKMPRNTKIRLRSSVGKDTKPFVNKTDVCTYCRY